MSTGESEGPAWNKFWLSMDNESDSMVSGGASHRPSTPHRSYLSPDPTRSQVDRGDSVLPNESASHHGDDAQSVSHSDVLDHHAAAPVPSSFPFKFKAPSGRVHRLHVEPSAGVAELISNVTTKLGPEVEAVGGAASSEDGKLSNSGYALSYLDNEGDTVSITTDQDLSDAVDLARQNGHDKVDLFVHDPEKPPIPVTVDPQPAVPSPQTPPESSQKEKSATDDSHKREYEESVKAMMERGASFAQPPVQEPLINGVPNELLLPGAIVTLAAVIAGVFVLSRSTGR
jgi:hypothetical protein